MRKIIAAALGMLFATAFSAQASLIGDEVRFQCTNCGPPTDDTFIVGNGVELTLFNQFEVDVQAELLRINWIFDSSAIISDLNFVWSDLDWLPIPGKIIGASINNTSTWPDNGFVSFTDDSVTFTNGADTTVSVGQFLLIDLDVEHNVIPLPATLPLILGALGIVGLVGRRGKKTKT